MKQKEPWQHTAQEAQEYRDASIARVQPEVPQLPPNLPPNVINIPGETLSQDEIQITETPPEDLLGLLASGGLTATIVTKAFLRRAGLAQKLVTTFPTVFPITPTKCAYSRQTASPSSSPSVL